jgi:hypothetical protein
MYAKNFTLTLPCLDFENFQVPPLSVALQGHSLFAIWIFGFLAFMFMSYKPNQFRSWSRHETLGSPIHNLWAAAKDTPVRVRVVPPLISCTTIYSVPSASLHQRMERRPPTERIRYLGSSHLTACVPCQESSTI